MHKCEFGEVMVWQCGKRASHSMTVAGGASNRAGRPYSVTFYVCPEHFARCRSSFGPLVDVSVVQIDLNGAALHANADAVVADLERAVVAPVVTLHDGSSRSSIRRDGSSAMLHRRRPGSTR